MKTQSASDIPYRVRSVRCAHNLALPLLGFLLALITAALFARAGSAVAAVPGSTAASPRFAPGHILVAPQPGSSSSDFQRALTAQGGRSLGSLKAIDVHMVEVPLGSEQDAVANLARNPHVLFAELDQLAPPAGTANDPYFRKEWHLAKINAPTAWDTSIGLGITIAILDSGIDGTHPDLAVQMVPGWNFFDNNSDTTDVYGHGTAVAGVAAAALNNDVGITGVAGGARLMPVRIADAAGYAYWSTAALGLTWAADHGAQVANISFEGMAASSTMQAAASYFRSKGGSVFVAAGNTGAVDNTAPTDTMIVVSATDNEDRITSWSTYGSFVDISAPGQDIYSTAMGGGYGTWSGTSMAAPIVAGTAALILALRPKLTPAQVAYTLRTTATGPIGPRIYYGYGRVNADAAVQAANAVPAAAAPIEVAAAEPVRRACRRGDPTVIITPSQSVGDQAGTMVPFNVTVTNNDTTACGVSGFDLTHSIPAGWTAAFLSSVIWLSPGTSVSTTLQVTSPAGTPNSSNLITVTATNQNSAKPLLVSASATPISSKPITADARKNGNTFLASASAAYVVANVVPGAPTIGTATSGNAQASASFTAPVSNGGSMITSYTVTSSPGAITASGAASPIIVTGLTNGTAYTFTVKATNAVGIGAASAASNSVTPMTIAVSASGLIGINVSGAEYSWETYPTTSDLDYLKSKGISLLRVPFAWEKMQPTLNGSLSPTELGKMKTFLTAVGARGMSAIIDMHNYARYKANWATSGNVGPDNGITQDNTIGSAAVPYSSYKDVWTKLATELKGQSGLVGYDIMNEPNNMPSPDVWPTAAQQAVDGIRSADMNTTIYVQGDHWSSASTWLQYNANLRIVDPANRLVYSAHQYFDDGSGRYIKTYDQYVATPNRGVDQIQPFLTWLKQNNAKGYVGEFAAPQDDPRWLVVLDNFIAALVANNVVGTYWKYTYRTPQGVAWWPNLNERNSITPSQNWGMPQLGIITKYTQPQQ